MSVVINGTTGIDTPGLQISGSPSKPFLGNTQFLTTNKTLAASDASDLLVCSSNITVTLPALSEGLVFGFVNNSDGLVAIATPNSATLVSRQAGGILLLAREEAILVCDGVGWQVIGANDAIRVQIVQFEASGTYVPHPLAKLFLACVNGATGGTSSAQYEYKSGSGGGGYSEKLYTAPFSASYSVTIGAGGVTGYVGTTGGTTTFGTISIASSPGVVGNAAAGGAGGVGTGGDFNATGGTGGVSNSNGGGGGGAATRAGNGGNGAAGTSGVAGGGGGTGGNNASGATGGVAATSVSGSAYSLTTFANTTTFQAGSIGSANSAGGYGASCLNTNSGFGSTFTIGSASASAGASGYFWSVGFGFPGYRGHVTIVEIF